MSIDYYTVSFSTSGGVRSDAMCLTRRSRRRNLTICIDLLTREYPLHVCGGAGTHVLELAKIPRGPVDDLRVQALDGPREPGIDGADPDVTGHADLPQLAGANATLRTLGVNLGIAAAYEGSDLVHSHTWYANFIGHVTSLLDDIPHVVSAHSLEPLRPWKAEQLGGGYRLSPYVERTVYEAVSTIVAVPNGMHDDILCCYPGVDPGRVHAIHNGIDLNKWHAPEGGASEELCARVLAEHGIDPSRRTAALVGRTIRQKGPPYSLRATQFLPDDVQLMLCAGAPDTPEIAAGVEGLVTKLRARHSSVVLISETLPQPRVAAILSSAQVFITPPVYEPLGTVNSEAMTLGLPVIGTATGGIPDVIVDGETGYLVPIEQKKDDTGTLLGPRAFKKAMTDRLVRTLDDLEPSRRMGEVGLARARDHFSQEAIGVKAAELCHSLVQGTRHPTDN